MARTPNRLINATSPYLQQHAHNPIDWYPWGDEALAKAKSENKPIFVSIGYSTCYWCHVMERDVFESVAIAEKMNEWFVNIKVDREERPEIDEIYMTARQLMTREGGWPNNVFLTPDLKPFYSAGTMASDERYGGWSFIRLAESLHKGWVERRDEVTGSAEQVTNAIRQFLQERSESHAPIALDASIADKLFQILKEHEDPQSGGFFQAPKFPHENFLLFLLKYHRHHQNKDALAIAKHTAECMAAGGIQDQIGGGFHRYAVDRQWRVPHFEKMLYNQALMARAYTELYSVTHDPYHKDVAARTLDYVLSDLTDTATGAFCSALDAETDAVEGAYYVWSEDELKQLLNKEELALFNQCYALAEVPSFPGHHDAPGKVIYAPKPLLQVTSDYQKLAASLKPIHQKLLAHRKKRKSPHLDNKIITAWNGLMIDALARAGAVLAEPRYTQAAINAAVFLFERVRLPSGNLARVYGHGDAMFNAYLEDYAYLAIGLLTLYRQTKDKTLLEKAVKLMEQADTLFFDKAHGSYYFTDGEEKLIVRIKQAADTAIPSCTAIMVHNLLDLSELTGEDKWQAKAKTLLENYSSHLVKSPTEFVTMNHALLRFLAPGQSK